MDGERGDWWQHRAGYAVDRANPEGFPPEGAGRGLAVAVLAAVLRAGLPIFDMEAAVDGEAGGVTVGAVPGQRTAVRVDWRQDADAEARMPTERWNAQQAAMNQALRAILTVQEFWLQDEPLGAPVTVLGAARPPVRS